MVGIYTSIRPMPMTTKVGQQVHFEELTHSTLIKQLLMMLPFKKTFYRLRNVIAPFKHEL